MNKKFSTLVAALLVSGVSYAVVSQMDGAAVANGVQTTAVAGLKAVTTDATEAQATVKFAAATDLTAAAVWQAEEVGGKYNLRAGNFYITTAGKLSKDKTLAAAFTVNTNTLVATVGGIECTLVVNGGALELVKTSTITAETKLTIFAATTGTSLAAIPTDASFIIAGQTDPETFAEGKKAVTGTVYADGLATITSGGAQTFTLEYVGSTIPGGTDAYYLKNGDAYLALNISNDGFIMVDTQDKASKVTIDANGGGTGVANTLKIGGKFLTFAATAVTSADDVASGTNATLLFNGAAVESAELKPTIANAANKYTVGASGTGLIATAPAPTPASVAINPISGSLTEGWTASGDKTAIKFQIKAGATASSGRDFLAVGAGGAVNCNAADASATTFELQDDGTLEADGKTLVFSDGALMAVETVKDTDVKVVLYNTDGEVIVSENAASGQADYGAGDFILGQQVSDPAALGLTASYLSTIQTATASLINGESYFIKTARTNTALAMVKGAGTDAGKYSLSTYTVKANEEVALRNFATATYKDALWKVTKIVTPGFATPRYQFTNMATGLKLAYDKTGAFDVNGEYNTFEIQGESLVYTANGSLKSVTVPGGSSTDLTFSISNEQPIINEPSDVADWVKKLNVTAGNGHGFGVQFKQPVGDKIKALNVEANPFTANSQITAVQGLNVGSFSYGSKAYTVADLSAKMLLRVAGSYTNELKQGTAEEKAAKVEAFRNSTFIVADTLSYSDIIGDQASNQYIPYITVKGSELMSAVGNVLTDTYGTDDDYKIVTKEDGSKVTGNKYGITRRIENACFVVDQNISNDLMKDPVYFKNATIILPNKNNKEGIKGQTTGATNAYSSITNAYIAVKEFGATGSKKYYVGAAANTTNTPRWDYVYLGLNNDVDYTMINGVVNIISRNYKTDGQVYANTKRTASLATSSSAPHTTATISTTTGLVEAKFVELNKPEGQFLVTGGDYDEMGNIKAFTFTNRESGAIITNKQFKTVPGAENVYAIVGTTDTVEIVSSVKGDKLVGYANFDQAKDLDNKIYNLNLNISIANVPTKAYLTEAHTADHAIAMDADSLEAAGFKLIKMANKADADHQYGDSIFVSVDRPYSYVKTVDEENFYKTAKDTVVTFAYAIYNASNGEFLNEKTVGNKQFFYCNPEVKYNPTANATELRKTLNKAQKFIIKQKADGTYQLISLNMNLSLPADQQIVFNSKFVTDFHDLTLTNDNDTESVISGKLYAGATENKIGSREDIYETTYNDLFSIVEVNAPKYRTMETAPFDTVRIYKEGMENVALFAETAKKEIVSGGHFLGMKHKADKDLTKTMFSFFVDTAYVNRADNYKPQYLLAIEADTLHGFAQCPVPAHGVEDTGRIDTVAGKFLTTMVDSIAPWGDKHNNPYVWETYPRLGFVKAKHIGDNLIVLRDNGIQAKADTIKLDNNNDKAGVFAFRYVDQASKSFLMETKGGWVKWLNGVPVVVSKIEEAEVFNFEATSNNPTSNDAITTSEVSVIASLGSVIVKGAAGKKVAISNILGQTIVNTVLTSDNAIIAVPAGIVVVAVEGEEAVKTVVK